MNSGLKNVIIFTLGAAAGSVASWYLLKTKYEQIAQEEIDSVKEVFSQKTKELKEKIAKYESEPSEPCDEIPEITEEEKKAERINYSILSAHYGINNEEKGGSEAMEIGTIKTIPPEDFGELDDYETISLTYYADGVLTDECDEIVEDIEEKIGKDSLSKFGEYEDDSVFVRNKIMKCDYEILKDERNYSDLNPEDGR